MVSEVLRQNPRENAFSDFSKEQRNRAKSRRSGEHRELDIEELSLKASSSSALLVENHLTMNFVLALPFVLSPKSRGFLGTPEVSNDVFHVKRFWDPDYMIFKDYAQKC